MFRWCVSACVACLGQSLKGPSALLEKECARSPNRVGSQVAELFPVLACFMVAHVET